MFPNEVTVHVDKIEIEPISPTCVRLVAWSNGKRLITLTSDPNDREHFRRMMEVPEVFLCRQAGLGKDEVLGDIRSRRPCHENR